MLGINLGSLNTSISLGTPRHSTGRLHCDLQLSDTSSRTCPSIISYTNTHRLIGDQASLVMKKNFKSTFTNLIRLVGFSGNSEYDKQELQYMLTDGIFDNTTHSFKMDIYNSNEIKTILPESIVIAYLNKLKQIYINQRNIQIDTITFAIPDHFTCYHKERFIDIIKTCGFSGNNVHIVNESTAITLYFGYKKYSEFFTRENVAGHKTLSVDPTIEKYVIFIDAGNSKTTFIFAKLTYNLFTVLSSITLPFLGGRDFDNELFIYCAKLFKEKTGIDISKNVKIKLRMMERISKWRKALTVNTDVNFSFESLADDEDLNFILTRKQFEEIIHNKIEEFKTSFSNFYNNIHENFPQVNIQHIEMAGELLRTPILQDIIKEISGITVSKTILTDECIAIGCSLYSSIMKGTFPIPNFQGIYHLNNYSISYSIEQQNKTYNHHKLIECIESNQQIPYDTSIVLPISKYGDKGKVKLSFYHQPDEIEFYLNEQSYELISYMLDLNLIYKYKKRKVEGIVIYIKVDNNGFIHLMGFDYVLGDNTTSKIKYEQGMVDVLYNGLYCSKDIKKNKENYLLNEENKYLKMDKEFEEYSAQKNNIEGKCYSLRDVINNSKKEHVEYKNTNKTLMEILNSIEEDLRDAGDKKINLTPIYQQIVDIASIVGYNMN